MLLEGEEGLAFGGEVLGYEGVQGDECQEGGNDDDSFDGGDYLRGLEQCDGALDCWVEVVCFEI